MADFNAKQYNKEYRAAKIKRVPLDMQLFKYDEIKAAAKASGESVNGYIKKAIDERMEREGAAPAPAAPA